jgi:hypothetical protein
MFTVTWQIIALSLGGRKSKVALARLATHAHSRSHDLHQPTISKNAAAMT